MGVVNDPRKTGTPHRPSDETVDVRLDANVTPSGAKVRTKAGEAGRLRAERERNEAQVGRVQAEADRNRAEADRDRAEQSRAIAEEERTAVELLMAVLAHDLRNPLGAITASAQRLRRTGSFQREQDRQAVERIASSVARVTRMVDQLLDFERIRSAGGIPVKARVVNLGDICREIIDEIRHLHPDRQVLLQISGDAEGLWDPDRLAQVVDNLITNGLQYGARDRPIEVSISSEEGQVVLEIENRGMALDPETQRLMFDPFRRLSDRTPGLGLGLFIVQQIVLAHHGTIDVESSDAEGTVFVVKLPRGLG
jgi:signal transduction histidine kinase